MKTMIIMSVIFAGLLTSGVLDSDYSSKRIITTPSTPSTPSTSLADSIYSTSKMIHAKYVEIVAKHGTNNNEAKAEMVEYLENLEKEGYIYDVYVDPISNIVSFKFAGGGLGGVLLDDIDECKR